MELALSIVRLSGWEGVLGVSDDGDGDGEEGEGAAFGDTIKPS
jgi:hypothetical protein